MLHVLSLYLVPPVGTPACEYTYTGVPKDIGTYTHTHHTHFHSQASFKNYLKSKMQYHWINRKVALIHHFTSECRGKWVGITRIFPGISSSMYWEPVLCQAVSCLLCLLHLMESSQAYRYALLFRLFHRWRNWDSERLVTCLEVTQLATKDECKPGSSDSETETLSLLNWCRRKNTGLRTKRYKFPS